jgi:hypothetical protein
MNGAQHAAPLHLPLAMAEVVAAAAVVVVAAAVAAAVVAAVAVVEVEVAVAAGPAVRAAVAVRDPPVRVEPLRRLSLGFADLRVPQGCCGPVPHASEAGAESPRS